MLKKQNNNRESERASLYSGLWKMANDLRGTVTGWDFKQYVLGFLFYRYISENLTKYINDNERVNNPDFDYAEISDEMALRIRDEMIKSKGFFILPSQLFENVRLNSKNDENLNTKLQSIFEAIEDSSKNAKSENDFKGLFDDLDMSSNKLGNNVYDKVLLLRKILDTIGSMKLENDDYKENKIDAFGDAYEYLMGMYAKNAGKGGGEYFTPQEVSELLAKLTVINKTKVNKVYDPACGSGSLLLKFAKILGVDNVTQGFFGQEKELTTYNLCRINMFLHDIEFNKFDIRNGDTLLNPLHKDLEPFDAIVSNPPYSLKWDIKNHPELYNDRRFSPAGVLAPASKSDFAFIMHSLSWLSESGVAAIVCFPGIFYRSGNEQKIRKYLIDNNYIDAIIQMPKNLFYGTSIETYIMILKKSKTENKTFFINASNYCEKVTNSNKLSDKNIEDILKIYTDRKDIKHISRLVDNSDVHDNKYNLSVNNYVEMEDNREEIDIKKVNTEVKEIASKVNKLREELDEIISNLKDFENDNK